MSDLLQKNFWTSDERQEFAFGSKAAYERARAKNEIRRLQKKLAASISSQERTDVLADLDRWQTYLSEITPMINHQLAAE